MTRVRLGLLYIYLPNISSEPSHSFSRFYLQYSYLTSAAKKRMVVVPFELGPLSPLRVVQRKLVVPIVLERLFYEAKYTMSSHSSCMTYSAAAGKPGISHFGHHEQTLLPWFPG